MTSDGVPFLDLSAMHAEIRTEVDAAMAAVADRNAFIGGPWVERFEDEFAAYCDRSRCIGVANGTDALELILAGLGVGPGDEVIVPTNTFIATAEAVARVGATPVFVDVEPSRLLMTADTIAPHLTPRTTACIVVHLFGQPADMDDIVHLTERHGIALVEDAAQAHGATWNGRRIGSFGVASAFSFYPGKNLGAFGDAGAVVTDDAGLADTIRTIANHGRAPQSHHEHSHIGTNSRLDGLQAAVLSIKLRELDRWNEGRRAAHARYVTRLGDGPVRVLADSHGAVAVHHLEVIRSATRDDLERSLDAAGIGYGVHYPVPCHEQPPFRCYAREDLPVATTAAREILSVPMFPHLSPADVDRVADVLLATATSATTER